MTQPVWIPLVSSSLASLSVYPIDVIKTQYQIDNIKSQNNCIKTIVTNIVKKQGINGFYRGITPNLLSYPIFWSIFFSLKKIEYQPTNHKYLNEFINSCGHGAIASIITNPLFVFKTRVQCEIITGNKYTYPQMVHSIYQQEGLRGYYKGLNATLLNSFKLGIQMPLMYHIEEKTGNVWLASAVSKTFSSTIFYPFDLIRTVQRESQKNLSLTNIVKNIYQRNGIRGFFSGLFLYNLMTGPNFVLMMGFSKYLITINT